MNARTSQRVFDLASIAQTAIVITNATPTVKWTKEKKTNTHTIQRVTYYVLHAFSFNFIEELSLTFSSFRFVCPKTIGIETRVSKI